jgi:hypothetical protein
MSGCHATGDGSAVRVLLVQRDVSPPHTVDEGELEIPRFGRVASVKGERATILSHFRGLRALGVIGDHIRRPESGCPVLDVDATGIASLGARRHLCGAASATRLPALLGTAVTRNCVHDTSLATPEFRAG